MRSNNDTGTTINETPSSVSDNDLVSSTDNYNNKLAFAVANARSISAKINSLVDLFEEADLMFACLSETWLVDGRKHDHEMRELVEGRNISMITRNRGIRGGGVAIAYDDRKMQLKRVYNGKSNFEYVCALGKTKLNKREIFIVSCYYPPAMKVAEVEAMNEEIADRIGRAKADCSDPMVIVAGDMNRKRWEGTFEDLGDVEELPLGPTRRGAELQRCATNLGDAREVFLSSPLETDDGQMSDHRAAVCVWEIPRRDVFRKKTFTFRPFTSRGKTEFLSTLASIDWTPIHTGDPTTATAMMTDILEDLRNRCFPQKTRTIKSSDPPWVDQEYRRATRRRKRRFKRRGRDRRWKQMKKKTREMKAEKQERLVDKVVEAAENAGTTKAYFATANMLKHREAPQRWSPRDLYPEKQPGEIANMAADYFTKISREFTPLSKPVRRGQPRVFNVGEVAGKLKKMKKPNSVVKGDIDKRLVTPAADILAIPLTYIYNLVSESLIWPKLWKSETVTLLPKNPCPSSLGEVRNIACTPLFSKALESLILDELRKKVGLSRNQFGGVPGTGVDHFLVETWQDVLHNLEDNAAGAGLISIDFEKAFNRLDHGQVLEDLIRKGADQQSVDLVAAFLFDRTMAVKIDGVLSDEYHTPGGPRRDRSWGASCFAWR